MPTTNLDVKRFEQLLKEARARIAEELQRLRGGSGENGRAGWSEEMTESDTVSGDAAAFLLEKERTLSLADELARRLKEIDCAFERLAAGAYGACEICGEPIHPTRLEALPWTLLCVNCRELVE